MRKAGHSGAHAVNCPSCITSAEKMKMPWHGSHLDVFSSSKGDELKRKHAGARQVVPDRQLVVDQLVQIHHPGRAFLIKLLSSPNQ